MKYWKTRHMLISVLHLPEIAFWLIGYWTPSMCVCVCVCVCVCFSRERAASRAGPEADNMGDRAERELPGQTGAPALGEQ